MTKAIVDYCFNGSRFKLFVPSENCYVMFALGNVRCPQPSPNPGAISRGQGKYYCMQLLVHNRSMCRSLTSNMFILVNFICKISARPAEPFGDASKRHSRMNVLQRQVDIVCTGVTQGGVMTGDLFVGQGGQRRNYCIELVASGLATVDQRKIDYGEAPKVLIDSQTAAQSNKLGIWSIKKVVADEPKSTSFAKADEKIVDIQISEIRSGNHFFYRVIGDESAKVIDDSMKIFTEQNGKEGAPCEVKAGKVVAGLLNDGTATSWYRAKILEKLAKGKAKVLFVDHGNVGTVSTVTHLRPLDCTLGTDRIPAAAKEGILALTKVRPIEEDDGIDAARMFQSIAWGKDLKARLHGESDGQAIITLYHFDIDSPSINEQLTSEGLSRLGKSDETYTILDRMGNSDSLAKLMKDLKAAEDKARKTRKGIWIYGEIAEEDPETAF